MPESFNVPDDMQMDTTVDNLKDAMAFSEQIEIFCLTHGIEQKKCMYAAVCVEEISRNIINYGEEHGEHYTVDARVVIQDEDVIIQMRDDCSPPDLETRKQIHSLDDTSKDIGMQLVGRMAKEFDYANVLSLNNLSVRL